MKEAMLYEKVEDGKVKCNLCNHHCLIADGKRGLCGVRENQEGTLHSLVYRKAIAAHIDPIEKKPFFNFLPGTLSYSIATQGCNFRCKFCQNWGISQSSKEGGEITGEDISPMEIVKEAKASGCRSIAYTYTEPTVFFEYAYDTARLAREEGLKNVFVTNGFMTEEALREIQPYLDAANVDLKAFTEEFYNKICGAKLEPVKKSLKLMKELGIWVEITTLIIPTLNDSQEELKAMAEFISNELGPETPWHLSKYHPDYRMTDIKATPVETIHMARETGLKAGLRYVYAGNLPGDSGENTYCYSCNELLINRYLFRINENGIKDSKCPKCGAEIDGEI